MSPSSRPELAEGGGPDADEDSAAFWAALRCHQLVLQRCLQCGRIRFPPMSACPNCGDTSTESVSSPGLGHVYSWIVAHLPLGSLTQAELPCTIVTVELDEGCRILGRLDKPAVPRIGLRVAPQFVDHDDWTELAFVTGEES